jgi:hypothetical protein
MVLLQIRFSAAFMVSTQNSKAQPTPLAEKTDQTICVERGVITLKIAKVFGDFMHHGGLVHRTANEQNFLGHIA